MSVALVAFASMVIPTCPCYNRGGGGHSGSRLGAVAAPRNIDRFCEGHFGVHLNDFITVPFKLNVTIAFKASLSNL